MFFAVVVWVKYLDLREVFRDTIERKAAFRLVARYI